MKFKHTMLLFFFLALIIFFVGYVVVAMVFTFRARAMPEQIEFNSGHFPDPLPNGDLKGTADGQGSWQGKSFDAATNTGINRFLNNGQIDRSAPFKTYKAKGLNDNKDVLVLDYNVPENPFHVKFIYDEIVETAPGKYIGKIHLNILPFVPFTVGYFRLEM